MNNWEEFVAGTNPTNAQYVLRMSKPDVYRPLNYVFVSWQSVTNRTYCLERSTNFLTGFTCLESNVTGWPDSTSFTDTRATGSETFFYRVGVK